MMSSDTTQVAAAGLHLDWTVTVGNLVTALTVAVSAATLVYTQRKDRHLREREYADRIRHAAGLTIARLERWQRIVQSIFDEIQPAFVDVDRWAVAGKDMEQISDRLWKELSRARAQAAQRIMEEEVELSFLDLYAYHRGVHDRFNEVIREQQRVRQRVFTELLTNTQRLLLRYRGIPVQRTFIGNEMREEAVRLRREFMIATSEILDRFVDEMRPLVTASDTAIYARDLPPPFAVPPERSRGWVYFTGLVGRVMRPGRGFAPPLREHFIPPLNDAQSVERGATAGSPGPAST